MNGEYVEEGDGVAHHFPEGEAGHTASPQCPCGPYEASFVTDDGGVDWEYLHEKLSRRKRAA